MKTTFYSAPQSYSGPPSTSQQIKHETRLSQRCCCCTHPHKSCAWMTGFDSVPLVTSQGAVLSKHNAHFHSVTAYLKQCIINKRTDLQAVDWLQKLFFWFFFFTTSFNTLIYRHKRLVLNCSKIRKKGKKICAIWDFSVFLRWCPMGRHRLLVLSSPVKEPDSVAHDTNRVR